MDQPFSGDMQCAAVLKAARLQWEKLYLTSSVIKTAWTWIKTVFVSLPTNHQLWFQSEKQRDRYKKFLMKKRITDKALTISITVYSPCFPLTLNIKNTINRKANLSTGLSTLFSVFSSFRKSACLFLTKNPDELDIGIWHPQVSKRRYAKS